MSAPKEQAPASSAAQPQFPPPPAAPPSIQTSQTPAPKRQHPDEKPLPEYEGEDIYNATPISEHSPQFPPTHDVQQDGTPDGKKKHKLKDSFKEYYNKAAESLTTHVGPAVNAMARKTGAEGFIAESLDKECEKAARILKAFCKDGIYADVPAPPPSPTPTPMDPNSSSSPKAATKQKQPRVLLTIPSKVIARAQGLAIFSAFRAGFQGTVTGGSGILIARTPSGTWSPPAGIRVGGVGAGFVAGAEIYDCVVVINTREALELFTKTRMSLGSDLAVTAGPFGAGGALEWGVPTPQKEDKGKAKAEGAKPEQAPLSADHTHFTTPAVKPGESTDPLDDPTKGKKPAIVKEAIGKPVYSYVKSHGVYAGVQVSGTVIIARESANARFYGREGITVKEILEGKVVETPAAAKGLIEVLKGAEGLKGGNIPTSPGFPPPVVVGVGAAPTAATQGTPVASAVPAANAGGSNVSAGVQGLDRGDSGTTPVQMASSVPAKTAAEIFGDAIPPPPPGPPPVITGEKSAESSLAGPPPPTYSLEPQPGSDDLPPAYTEEQGDGSGSSLLSGPPATGDAKSGLH